MWHALGLDSLTKYGEEGILNWNAHYDGESDSFMLRYPYGGWLSCDIDQYTEHGFVNGIAYELDLNSARDGLFNQVVFDTREDEVRIKQLDQAESIAALNKAAEIHGQAINDQPSSFAEAVPVTIVEITEGSPVPIPPGGHAFIFVTED